MSVPAMPQIRITLPGVRLLREAFRVCQRAGVSAFNRSVSGALQYDLQDTLSSGHDELSVANTEELRSVAMDTLGNASHAVSGIWRAYFGEMRAAFGECGDRRRSKPRGAGGLIDMERRMNPRARGEQLEWSGVECIIKTLQKRSDDWKERRYPNTLTAARLHHLLKRVYLKALRPLKGRMDCMESDVARGITLFYKDNVELMSAFASLSDRRIGSYLCLAEIVNYAFGMVQLNETMDCIRERICKGSDARTAVALMGHEVGSRTLMKWVMGHRRQGSNLIRMHGDMFVSQLGCAEENLLRASFTKDLGMVQSLVRHLDEEVSVDERDPVAAYARLSLLKRTIQVARGLYGEDMDPLRLTRHEREVEEEMIALEKQLSSRAVNRWRHYRT